jgi:hypothetical protein
MTANTGATFSAAFGLSLMECVEDLNRVLPDLTRRYGKTVVISALAEHVGSALKVMMRKELCDVREARQVIKNIESSAFLQPVGVPQPPRSVASVGGTATAANPDPAAADAEQVEPLAPTDPKDSTP